MAGITVSAIIKDLERRTQAREMDALAQLTISHADAVRGALASLRPRATIDLPVLLSTISREVAEAEARRPHAGAWRWAIELMNDPQREQFKRLVADGTDPDTAAREAMASGPVWGLGGSARAPAFGNDVQPDDASLDAALDALDSLDDESDAEQPKRRRSLPRLRSRRLVPTKRKSKPEPAFVGGIAAFDDYGRIGPEPGLTPLRPPWLLSDGDDDPDDEPEPETQEGESRCPQPI